MTGNNKNFVEFYYLEGVDSRLFLSSLSQVLTIACKERNGQKSSLGNQRYLEILTVIATRAKNCKEKNMVCSILVSVRLYIISPEPTKKLPTSRPKMTKSCILGSFLFK